MQASNSLSDVALPKWAKKFKVGCTLEPEVAIRQGQFVCIKVKIVDGDKSVRLRSANFNRYVGDNGILFAVGTPSGEVFMLVSLVTKGKGKKDIKEIPKCAMGAKCMVHQKDTHILETHEKTCKNCAGKCGTGALRSISLVPRKNELLIALRVMEGTSHAGSLPFRLRAKIVNGTTNPMLTNSFSVDDRFPKNDFNSNLLCCLSFLKRIVAAGGGEQKNIRKIIRKMKKGVESDPMSSNSSTEKNKKGEALFGILKKIEPLYPDMPTRQDHNGMTICHYAALLGFEPIVAHFTARMLAEEINVKDINGITILHYAAHSGQFDTVQMLVARGADPNQKDQLNESPKEYAQAEGFADVVEILSKPVQKPRGPAPGPRTTDSPRVKPGPGGPVKPGPGPAGVGGNPSGAAARPAVVDEEMNPYEAAFRNRVEILKKELEKAKNVDIKDSEDATPLHHAAFAGAVDCLKLLISMGANVNSVDKELRTALHKAAFEGNPECVELLLAQGADINAKDQGGATPLHLAAFSGSVPCIEMLMKKGSSLTEPDYDGRLPLHKSAYAGQVEAADFLVKNGAVVDCVDSRGATPLHIAAYKDQFKCAQLLVGLKANINVRDTAGVSTLHHTCFKGNYDFTKFLIEHKADINGKDTGGQTPLSNACYKGDATITKLLLDSGADTNFPAGFTSPLHHCAVHGHADCLELVLGKVKGSVVDVVDREGSTALHKAAYFGHLQCVDLLVKAKADVTLADSEGSTPLHKAAFSGKSECVSRLLQAGADVECQDGEEGTPLHNAAFNGHIECVNVLLGAQANLNSADSNGASPLHLAVLNGHKNCAALLLEKGSLVDSQDDRGMTPLHHAIEHPECVLLLAEEDADVNCKDADEHTALYYAILDGFREAAVILLDKGADPNIADKEGNSPRSIASESFSVLISEALEKRQSAVNKELKQKMEIAVKKFNRSPEKGVEYLVAQGLNDGTPAQLAKFLRKEVGLDKTKVGDFLSTGTENSSTILKSYLSELNFKKLTIDEALRVYLKEFRLPGEAQRIDRLMESFAVKYCEDNPDSIFTSTDSAYLLAFAIIMLNTDAHSPSIAEKDRMTKPGFVKNSTGILPGGDLPTRFLEDIYDRIVKNEIKMESEDSTIWTRTEKKGWLTKRGGRIKNWKRRWFVLADNCLYYYLGPEKETAPVSEPCGIVPLNNLVVRELSGKKKFMFEIYGVGKQHIVSCKMVSGVTVQGRHDSFMLAAENVKEMKEWIQALRANIFSSPFHAMITERKEKVKRTMGAKRPTQSSSKIVSPAAPKNAPSPRDSKTIPKPSPSPSGPREDYGVDWRTIHSLGMMCATCYKTPKAIKEVYGTHAVVEKPFNTIHSFYVRNEQKKAQRVIISGALWRNLPGLKEEMEKPGFDPFVHYQLAEATDVIVSAVLKHLKNDFEVQISGHGLGAVVAMLISPILKEKGFVIDGKVVTFAQPKVFLKAISDKSAGEGGAEGKEEEGEKEKEKEEEEGKEKKEEKGATVGGAGGEWYARCMKEVHLLRVSMYGDPIPLLFQDCEQVGAEVLLLNDMAFATADKPITVSDAPPPLRDLEDNSKMALHSMDNYLRNIKIKIKEQPQMVEVADLTDFIASMPPTQQQQPQGKPGSPRGPPPAGPGRVPTLPGVGGGSGGALGGGRGAAPASPGRLPPGGGAAKPEPPKRGGK